MMDWSKVRCVFPIKMTDSCKPDLGKAFKVGEFPIKFVKASLLLAVQNSA